MLTYSPPWARRRSPPARRRLRLYRPHLQELEPRTLPSSIANLPLTTNPDVQQQPSLAVDPNDSQHVVIAFMDYSLVSTGYAGIGTEVSEDGGASWSKESAIPLPADFDQGAANPIVQFDGQGHVFVSFMSVTFNGPYESPLTNGNFEDRGVGTASNNGIFVVRSDDGGLSWNPPVPVVEHIYDGTHLVPFDVIPDLAIDTFRTLPDGQPNPNYGNQYVVWTRVYPQGGIDTDIYIAVSKDGGESYQTQLENVPGFSIPVTVLQDSQNDPFIPDPGGPAQPTVSLYGGGFIDQANVTVGPEGDVYVAYTAGGDFSVAHSTDAGASFVVPDYINSPDGGSALQVVFGNGDNLNVPETGIGNSNLFRTFPVRDIVADPTRPGYVYAVSTMVITDAEGNTLDSADVLFARSTDYGVHWTSTFQLGSNPDATVLNDDNGGESATGVSTDVISAQADPRLSVDAQGNISVIWYDTRRDPAGHDLDVFGTTSTDGGLTFSPNFPVTAQSFDANQGAFKNPTTQPSGPEDVMPNAAGKPVDVSGQDNYNIGEYLGLALANNTAYAAWTDTLAGNQDIYFSSYSLAPAPAPPNNRFAPNQTPKTATDLGKVVQRLVPKLALPVGDEDWFSVQAAATGNLTVAATSIGDVGLAPNTLQLQLYDESGNNLLVAGTDPQSATRDFIGQQLVYPSNAGQSFLVRVFRTDATDTSPTLYELSLQSLTADLGAQAFDDVSDTIMPGGQALYRLTAPASGSLQIQFTNGANVQGNLNLQVIDASTSAILSNPPPLIITPTGPNESIPEATPTGLIDSGSAQVAGDIGDGPFGTTTGDYNFYSLWAAAGERINVNLADPQNSTLDGVIALYDSGGNLLLPPLYTGGPDVEDSNGPGTPEFVSFVTTKADTYYVAIYGSTSTDAPPTDPFTPGTGGGVPTHAGAYNLTITVQAVGPGAVQQYSIPVQQGQTLLLQVTGEGQSTGDFQVNLVNLDQFTTPDSSSLLFPAGAGPSTMAVGDLNGDGFPDVVVANALSNTVSVLINNKDGTFQAPRQYAIGSFQVPNPTAGGYHLNDFRRQVVLADLTGDGHFDIVVTNFDSGDISVLLNRGDGTFEPQRRFDATANPFGLAVGDLTGNGIPDIVAIDSQPGTDATIAVLLGRGDGTFEPEPTFRAGIGSSDPFSTVYLADLTGNGKLDLIVSGSNIGTTGMSIFMGNGDGTFQKPVTYPAGRLGAGVVVADINGDGIPDIINTGNDPNGLGVLLGNGIGGKGNGTFAPYLDQNTSDGLFPAGQAPVAVAVADLATGLATLNPDGSIASTTTTLGKPDGHLDLIVAASGGISSIVSGTSPGIYVVPTLWDAQGHFAGFGAPLLLASADVPLDVKVADVNGDDVPDVLFLDADGVHVIYGTKSASQPNNTAQAVRNLGIVVHVVEPTLTIVPRDEDNYYTLTVPTEAVQGAGDEILDFSGDFQALGRAGITMQVRDAAGNLLGSGERFQVVAAQGTPLTLDVFGLTAADGSRGVGAYTLDIDVLPQVVSSVQPEALLPGTGPNPGGPTTSLVITFQGDRLDPTTAQDPANYTVTLLGPDGLAGIAADQQIPVASAVYDPSTNVYNPNSIVPIAIRFPVAVQQTVTLTFANPLLAGSYVIEVASAVQTAPFNSDEANQLTLQGAFVGHSVASLSGWAAVPGSQQQLVAVLAPGTVGNLDTFNSGTPFLTQLHDDLGALLDDSLTHPSTSNVSITAQLNQQILDRFVHGLVPANEQLTGVLVLWLDPVPLSVVDPQGQRANYNYNLNQQEGTFLNSFSNDITNAFVSVLGNIEVLVLPTIGGTFTLNVADVPAQARGGAVVLGGTAQDAQLTTAYAGSNFVAPLVDQGATDQAWQLTNLLQAGITDFVFNLGLITAATGTVLVYGTGTPVSLGPLPAPPVIPETPGSGTGPQLPEQIPGTGHFFPPATGAITVAPEPPAAGSVTAPALEEIGMRLQDWINRPVSISLSLLYGPDGDQAPPPPPPDLLRRIIELLGRALSDGLSRLYGQWGGGAPTPAPEDDDPCQPQTYDRGPNEAMPGPWDGWLSSPAGPALLQGQAAETPGIAAWLRSETSPETDGLAPTEPGARPARLNPFAVAALFAAAVAERRLDDPMTPAGMKDRKLLPHGGILRTPQQK